MRTSAVAALVAVLALGAPRAAHADNVADPFVCPILVQLGALMGGGIRIPYVGPDGEVHDLEVVTISAQGDVHLAGDLLWDCPPYEIGPS